MSRSKADHLRLDQIHNMPCICCFLNGINQPSPTEAHHLVDRGNREVSGGHQATIPLCRWHHRAETIVMGKKQALERFWPSLKYQGDKGRFMRFYGTERELLARVNELIGES